MRTTLPVSLLPLAATCILSGLGVAPLPAHAAAGARLVHRYRDVRLSPDATHVASIEGDAPVGGSLPAVRDLMIRSVAGGAAVRVDLPCGRVPQCWPDSITWTDDGKSLAFTLRTPGSHRYSLYTVAADGTHLKLLLAFGGTLTDLKLHHDTLALLAIENARKEVGATEAGAAVAGDLDTAPAEQRIAILDGAKLRWVSPAELFVYEYDWLPDGSGFVATASPGDGDSNWWTAKLHAFSRDTPDARTVYTPSDIRQQIAKPSAAPDGKSVVFIGGIMSDFGSTGGDIYSVPLAGGPAVNLTPGMHASARALGWSCSGTLQAQLLAGDHLELVDLGAGREVSSPRVLASDADTVQADAAVQSFACPSGLRAAAHESFTAPPEIEVGTPGEWHDLTHLNAGLADRTTQVRSLHWDSEKWSVQGWLLLPPGVHDKLPMVTIVHGGPASAAVPHFLGPGTQTAMLERGWALFYPNPRGSYGQGEAFTLANVRDLGHGDLRDILAGIDAAERSARIDEARLGLTGGSYGGFMTMWAVTQTQRFKAGVAAAGVSNWQSYYGENGIDEWLQPYFGASVYDDPEVYARSSPINFIRNVHTPTFSYVGERDLECPAPQTVEFWHALKALGVPTAVMIYPGEGHGLRDPADAEDAMRRTLSWFDHYLR
jgi:dipeptidyl aminopeptidase/acylaminoacyl peptidase